MGTPRPHPGRARSKSRLHRRPGYLPTLLPRRPGRVNAVGRTSKLDDWSAMLDAYNGMSEGFSDAALVLVGHGSTLNAESSAPVYQHADELRKRKIFAQVQEAFWKVEPYLA